MPFFKRLMAGISSIKNAIWTRILTSLTNKYPEIDKLLEIVNLMRRQYHEECIALGIADDLDGDGFIDESDEDRYVPTLLTLGLIYKLQKNDAKSWYNRDTSFLHDTELQDKFLHTFGYFWHLLLQISKAIRNPNNEEKQEGKEDAEEESSSDPLTNLRRNIALIPGEDVIYAHSTNQTSMDNHSPDFALTMQRDNKILVLTICGTRMIPAPEMKDVFMDLYADSEPFLHGHAHRGMAIGSRNIVELVMPTLLQALAENPDYELLITGYSLGAGISQLVTMELVEGESAQSIPSGTIIRCLSYGTPPVFQSDEKEDYKCPNVYSISFNNDGLISASITNVLKLFMQIRALENINMRRRDMCRLLFSNSDSLQSSYNNDNEVLEDDIEDDNPDDDADEEIGDTEDNLKSSLWSDVREAINKVNHVGHFKHLEHPSKLFIFKRKNDVITRVFQDTNPFTSSLRLRASMFNDHMPWGYNSLFQGYGVTSDLIHLDSVGLED